MNEQLKEALEWALFQAEGATEELIAEFLASQPLSTLLNAAARTLFIAGYNPRGHKADIIRQELIRECQSKKV